MSSSWLRAKVLSGFKSSSLLALACAVALLLSACAGGSASLPTALPAPSPTAVPNTQASAPQDCDVVPTASNPEGPYYRPGAPERSSLLESGMEGTRLILTGMVMTTSCEPIPDASLDFWQTNAQGEYDNAGYTLRGVLFSDADGEYRLETILPGLYPGRPAHIHVKVSPPDGPTLTTQIYFIGDEFGRADSLVDPSLLTALTAESDGSQSARFDFVLAP